MLQKERSKVAMMILAALLAGLTAVGARIQIPVFGIPMTLQTFFVYFSGVLLGARWGMTSQGLYLLMGFVGLPVFAGGDGGLHGVMLPTFGFLVGFFVCAGITGFLVERWGQDLKHTLLAAFLGIGVVFFFGIIGFAANMTYVAGKSIPFLKMLGIFVPFLALDMGKAVGAAFLATQITARLAARNGVSQKN